MEHGFDIAVTLAGLVGDKEASVLSYTFHCANVVPYSRPFICQKQLTVYMPTASVNQTERVTVNGQN
jgi:hypothetical protein